MAKERRDKKNRILWKGEYQRSDGMYEYKYTDTEGGKHSVYSWMLTQTDKPPKGKKSEKCLRELEKQIERDKQDGIKTATAKKETLNEYFDKYMERKTKLKQSTRTNYKYMYNKYVRDKLGTTKLASIKFSDVRNFYDLLILQHNFKPRSMEIIHTILHPVFELAVKDDVIRKNPSHGVMKEIKNDHNWEKSKRHALTEEQQTAFVDYIAKSDKYKHWLPLFTVFLGTGCRVGEIIGLRWEDCDFEEGIISINHNLIYRLQDSGNCEYHITTPKSEAGKRIIPMFKDVRKALLAEKDRQARDGFNMDVIDGYSGFIFTNRYGKVYNPHCINRAIVRIYTDYNAVETTLSKEENREPILLPHFSVHNLRHTFCTRFCENETNIKIIQEIMGHADITTTMDVYNEATKKKKMQSFEALEGKIKIS